MAFHNKNNQIYLSCLRNRSLAMLVLTGILARPLVDPPEDPPNID